MLSARKGAGGGVEGPIEDVVMFSTMTAGDRIAAYRYEDGVLGARLPNPAENLPGEIRHMKLHPDGNAILVGHHGPPYISAYEWIPGVGFGQKYDAPADPPTGASGWVVDWHPSGNALALLTNNRADVWAYAWSHASGFGARYVAPETMVGNSSQGIAFSRSQDVLVTASSAPSPQFGRAYAFGFTVAGGFSSLLNTLGFAQAPRWLLSDGGSNIMSMPFQGGHSNRVVGPSGIGAQAGTWGNKGVGGQGYISNARDWMVQTGSSSPYMWARPYTNGALGTPETSLSPAAPGQPSSIQVTPNETGIIFTGFWSGNPILVSWDPGNGQFDGYVDLEIDFSPNRIYSSLFIPAVE
jgi:hypothetical protein